MDDWINTTEAAELLGVHPGTLRNQRMNGRENVRSHKVGSAVLYRRTEVLAFRDGVKANA